MVNAVIQEVSQLANIPVQALSGVVLGSGILRSKERFNTLVLVYAHGQPEILAKLSPSSVGVKREEAALQRLHAQGFTAPLVLGHRTINHYECLFLSYVPGQTLQDQIERGLISSSEALRLSAEGFDALQNATRETSSEEAFRRELSQLLSPLQNGNILGDAGAGIAEDLHTRAIKLFSSGRFETTLRHGDYILRNLICNSDGKSNDSTKHSVKNITLIDFEFCTRSHFSVLDWIRLFHYSDGVDFQHICSLPKPQSIHGLIEQPWDLILLKLLELLSDYQLHIEVLPKYRHAHYTAELKNHFFKFHDLLHSPDAAFAYFNPPKESSTSPAHFNAYSALELAQKQIQKLEERMEKQKHDIESRDKVIADLISCHAFRIGKVVTSTLKRIPGTAALRKE